MCISFKIKNILKEKEITIKDLAVLTGISLNTLYGITKRNTKSINPDTLSAISEVLKVPPQYLLGIEGKAKPIWTKEELEEMEQNSDEYFLDSEDGLLAEIIQIAKDTTTEGRLLIFDYLRQNIKNKYVAESGKDELIQEFNQIKLLELKSMYADNIFTDDEYRQLSLAISKDVCLSVKNSRAFFSKHVKLIEQTELKILKGQYSCSGKLKSRIAENLKRKKRI